jgi:hypothetical protein
MDHPVGFKNRLLRENTGGRGQISRAYLERLNLADAHQAILEYRATVRMPAKLEILNLFGHSELLIAK